jgi:hypothetical protein
VCSIVMFNLHSHRGTITIIDQSVCHISGDHSILPQEKMLLGIQTANSFMEIFKI